MLHARRGRFGVLGAALVLLTGACQALLDDEGYSFPSSDAGAVIASLGGTPSDPGGCAEGFHACEGLCVDSTRVETCGALCTPCPAPEGGAAACEGGQCAIECRAGQQPCGAECIPAGSACEGQCAPGQHDCGGSCVPDTSTLSCGSSCEPCATPASGGIPTCDGSACGVRCEAEFHACAGECLPNADLASCGSRCEPCPAPENGQASCDGVSCGVVCELGFHDCNGQCVSDSSPDSCGGSCQPCPTPEGGRARCEEARFCVPECRADQVLCRTRCIGLDEPCEGECPASTHLCGDFCSPDNDPSSCGERCEPCPAGRNGVATCESGVCGLRCNTDHHECDGACVSNFDINSCGSSCAPCPAGPSNGRASCNVTAEGPSCDFSCRAGFHRCGTRCLSDASVSSCGSSCTPCRAPANGRATCNGTSCDIVCNSGFFECCGACVADGSSCRSPCFVIVEPLPPVLLDPTLAR